MYCQMKLAYRATLPYMNTHLHAHRARATMRKSRFLHNTPETPLLPSPLSIREAHATRPAHTSANNEHHFSSSARSQLRPQLSTGAAWRPRVSASPLKSSEDYAIVPCAHFLHPVWRSEPEEPALLVLGLQEMHLRQFHYISSQLSAVLLIFH